MRRFLITGVAFAALAVAACSTASTTNLDDFITTVANKTNCHVTTNFAVAVGAINPGSGVQMQGTLDCPPVSAVTAATAASSALATPPAPATAATNSP